MVTIGRDESFTVAPMKTPPDLPLLLDSLDIPPIYNVCKLLLIHMGMPMCFRKRTEEGGRDEEKKRGRKTRL